MANPYDNPEPYEPGYVPGQSSTLPQSEDPSAAVALGR
jgi:hypothetical protein